MAKMACATCAKEKETWKEVHLRCSCGSINIFSYNIRFGDNLNHNCWQCGKTWKKASHIDELIINTSLTEVNGNCDTGDPPCENYNRKVGK